MTFNIFGREIYIRKEIIAVIIVFAVAALGTIGFLASRNGSHVVFQKQVASAGSTEAAVTAPATKTPQTDGEAAKSEDRIEVYVVGCVNNPGIVRLNKGQIIDEAIKAAGGATTDADLGNINLVYKLKDNVMLRIRPVKQGEAAKAQTVPKSSEAGAGIEMISDSGGAVVNEATVGGTKTGGKVNINTASAAELDSLPGIGESTAQDIIAYRQKSGPFKSIDDIMKIPGIKESKFSKIKDLITVE